MSLISMEFSKSLFPAPGGPSPFETIQNNVPSSFLVLKLSVPYEEVGKQVLYVPDMIVAQDGRVVKDRSGKFSFPETDAIIVLWPSLVVVSGRAEEIGYQMRRLNYLLSKQKQTRTWLKELALEESV